MIESIKIDNYITCNNLKIIFKKPLMVLVGKNAVGKTNTLMGIYRASKWCTMGVSEEKNRHFFNKGFSAEFVLKYMQGRSPHHFIYKYKFYGKKIYVKDSLWIVENRKKRLLFKKTEKTILTLCVGKGNRISIPSEFSGLRYLLGFDIEDKEQKPDFIKQYNWVVMQIFIELLGVKYYANQQ